ncbi:MAG: hypothetical protein AAGE99_01945 [Chlamydiota bacterium]
MISNRREEKTRKFVEQARKERKAKYTKREAIQRKNKIEVDFHGTVLRIATYIIYFVTVAASIIVGLYLIGIIVNTFSCRERELDLTLLEGMTDNIVKVAVGMFIKTAIGKMNRIGSE